MIDAFLGLPFDTARDIGWTLVHFLWEGLLLAAAMQLVLPMCSGAIARHKLALGTLAAMAIAPLMTFLIIHEHVNTGAPLAAIAESAFENIGTDAPMFLPEPISAAASISWTDWLVMLWLAGIAVLSVRALGGWYVAESLRRRDAFPLSPELLLRCRGLQQRLAISAPVQFLQSRRVRGLAVVGWFRPTVLIPISAITGLSPQYLDALIAHELAHIRRFDTFTNLLLIAVETILFYHPAVWWVGRRVRIEREQCCDDIAVSVCGDATVYVEALTTLETWKGTSTFALAANGGKLKQRVARLLGILPESRKFSLSALTGVAFLSLVGAGCAITQSGTQTGKPVFAIRAVVETANNNPQSCLSAAKTPADRIACGNANPPCASAAKTAVDLLACSSADRKSLAAPPTPDADLVPMAKFPWTLPAKMWLKREGQITKDMVTDANASTDIDGHPIVEFSLNGEGGKRLAAMTRANIGQQIAIVVNGTVVSAPMVNAELGGSKGCGSTGIIWANNSTSGARAMADAIRPAKALPLTPSPGTEAAVRRYIEAEQRGELNYDDMTPERAGVARKNSAASMPLMQTYGRLKSLTFKTVDPQCRNIFEASFEKRDVEFTIAPLTPEGKVEYLGWRGLPTSAQESALKQRIAAGKPDPERHALLLQEIAGEQNDNLKPEIMTPSLFATLTKMWPLIQETNKKFGKFSSLEFNHVDQRGSDVYEAVYENGRTNCRVRSLTADHKLNGPFLCVPADPKLAELWTRSLTPSAPPSP